MNIWNHRILLALAFSAGSTLAFGAGDPYGTGEAGAAGQAASEQLPSFEKIDADNSGFIEQSEAEAVAGLDMKTADADNDGKVSAEEYGYAKRNLMPTKGEMNLPSTGNPNVPAEVEPKQR